LLSWHFHLFADICAWSQRAFYSTTFHYYPNLWFKLLSCHLRL
jgi:hypothetical protein